mgnify:CR=1 FL=1
MRALSLPDDKTISINDLRRRFGEVERKLPFLDYVLVTKQGKPFAILSATPEAKRELMKQTAGAFKGTKLETDDIWKEVLKKKSRRVDITL